MPPNTVYVGRPGLLGNPFDNVYDFRRMMNGQKYFAGYGSVYNIHRKIVKALPELKDKDLACWCALDKKCHADVLLELANPGEK